eukprot:266084-Amphidinium_carterae.1
MRAEITQPQGSAGHSVAIEICHSIRIQNSYYRNRVIWFMDNLFRADPSARKRYNPDRRSGIEQAKFAGLVDRQDATEHSSSMLQHCLCELP